MGWKGLVDESLVAQAQVLNLQEVEAHRFEGGTILGTVRFNPYSEESEEGVKLGQPQIVWQNIQRLKLDGLLTL